MSRILFHLRIINALIFRDMMVRFGRSNLGFIWTFLEPMILCTGVMFIWSLIKEPIIHGIPVIAFVLTGYMPLTLWRHLINPMIRISRNNVGLLYHERLSHAHIMIARCVLEFFSTTLALILIYFVTASTGIIEPLVSPSLVLAAWLLAGWFSAALAFIISIGSEYWEPAERFIQPAMYLQLPVSGCFFMVDWVPAPEQRLLLLNPTVHFYEMFRGGFFGEAVVTHFSPSYLIAWCLAGTAIAAAGVYRVRDRIAIS